jgi:prepilin-type N-terminal cleavage/methylation domain-containing protein
MKPASATGFSLIELLVVITLIAILATSVIVRIRGVQDDRALQIAAEDLASAIRFGFEEYRLKGVIHRLSFADGGARYRLEEATGDAGQPYRPVRGVAGVHRRFPAGVEIEAVEPSGGQRTDGAGSELLCTQDGGFDGTIKLRNRQGETIALKVLAGTGQVHVEK